MTNKLPKYVCENCGKSLGYGRHCSGGCEPTNKPSHNHKCDISHWDPENEMEVPCRHKHIASHTPTPWDWRIGDDGSCVIEGKNVDEVVIWQEGSNQGTPYHGVEANAAFIVQAVNAYQPMVDALQRIAAGIRASNAPEWLRRELINSIEPALAKAAGK